MPNYRRIYVAGGQYFFTLVAYQRRHFLTEDLARNCLRDAFNWEHYINDEHDFEQHMDYLHYNPVKHGLVERAFQWPYSSFHRWVKEGIYPKNWGCGPMEFRDLDESAME